MSRHTGGRAVESRGPASVADPSQCRGTAFELAPEAMLLACGDPWHLDQANLACRDLFLFDPDAPLPPQLPLANLFTGGEPALQQLLDKLSDDTPVLKHETQLRDRFGLSFPAIVSVRRVRFGETPHLLAVVRDVNDRKRAEAQMNFFRVMAESSIDAIMAWSDGNTLVYANRACEAMFRLSATQLLCRPVHDLIEEPGVAERVLGEAVRRGNWQGEVRLRRGDRSCFDAYISTWRQTDAVGGLPVTVCLMRDVTEKKHAEQVLRESEEKYRHLFENLNDAAFLADAETGVILATNRQAETLLGRSREEIVGVNQAELHPPDHVEECRRVFKDGVAQGGTTDSEAEVIRKDGTVVPVEINGSVLTIGSRHTVLSLFRDVTETKRMHQAVERHNQNLEALVAERTREVNLLSRVITSTVTAWAISDLDGNLVRWNRAFEALTGYRIEEIIGMHWTDLTPEDEQEMSQARTSSSLAGEGHQIFEQGLYRAGGSVLPVEVRLDTLDVGEEVPVVFRIVTDISSHKEAEKRLIEAHRKTEETSQLKSEFLTLISHELRTPLNSILGIANTLVRLRERGDDTKTDDLLSRVIKSSGHLKDLIGEVLEISRIEGGRMMLKIEALKPAKVLHALEDQCGGTLEEHGLETTFTVAEATPPVRADRKRLMQILENILSNAVKFTDRGGRISITAARADGGNRVEFCVSDTGRGIPTEKLEQIFERFEQLDRSGSKLGVGLGLAICRQLAEAQGGRIWAESELGVGSRIYLTLPCSGAPATNQLVTQHAPEAL